MRLGDFDFPLPERLIAAEPAPERDGSRLLILGKKGIEHRRFRDVVDYLHEGDMLLLNDTKVLPARLRAVKPTGGWLDMLLVRETASGWEILCRGGYSGKVRIAGREAEVENGRLLRFPGPREELLGAGEAPLPPYIKRRPTEADKERYQTVYARAEGSIAAPTAGLHFTEELLEKIKAKGVLVRYLTLHVGRGTFSPVRADPIEGHKMEPEYFEMPAGLLEEIRALKAGGGTAALRGGSQPPATLFAVGTTVTRAVEGLRAPAILGAVPLSSKNGTLKGMIDTFIYPGFRFRAVSALITNFHLPCSSPLLLTAAFAGRERLLEAYRAAIRENYRFFSYGDAMLVL